MPKEWPSPAELDGVIDELRATWPEAPSEDQTVRLGELLFLRGMRDLKLHRPVPAVTALREATALLDLIAPPSGGAERSLVRSAWVARARAEIQVGHVEATAEALGRVLSLPYPHPGSELRATVRLVLDINELRGRLHRQGGHEQGLRLALQGHALAATAVASGGDRTERGLEGTSLAFLADSYAATGDVENALATSATAIALLKASPDPGTTLIPTLRMRARLLRHLGRTAEADEAVREATHLERS